AHRAQLAAVEQALGAAATPELEAAAAELRARIAVLEAFSTPLPELDLAQNAEGLEAQLAEWQSLLPTYQSLLDQTGLSADIAAVVSARATTISDNIAALQQAIDAAAAALPPPEPAPEPAPA